MAPAAEAPGAQRRTGRGAGADRAERCREPGGIGKGSGPDPNAAWRSSESGRRTRGDGAAEKKRCGVGFWCGVGLATASGLVSQMRGPPGPLCSRACALN
jgi:hypothetical protein